MAHLTINELVNPTAARAPERMQQIRARPGYGIAMLRAYKDVLPGWVLQAELERLYELQDRAAAPNPLAYAFTQLQRAYEEDDIPTIRRWETAVSTAGGRNYLRAVKARNRSYAARGIMGLGG